MLQPCVCCLLSAVCFSALCSLSSVICCHLTCLHWLTLSVQRSPRRNVERKAASNVPGLSGPLRLLAAARVPWYLAYPKPNGRLLAVLHTESQVPYRASGRMGQIPSTQRESAESECIAILRDVRLSPSFHQRLFFFLAPRNYAPGPSTIPQHTKRAFNRIQPRGPILPVSTKSLILPSVFVLYSTCALTLWPPAVSCSLFPIPTTSPCARVPRYLDQLPNVGLTTRRTTCFNSLLP